MEFLAPPGYQPIYGPKIPYLGPIYGGLREGTSIYIQGSIPEDITRFHINLRCGESESSDIALHVNPRFDGWDKVVFNSCQNESWGSEKKIHDMPFSKGEAFEIVIMITSQCYQIKVNGKDFYSFEHRIPVERVRAMQIAGDVSIQTINIIGGGMGGGEMGGGYPGGGIKGGYPGDVGGGMGGEMGGGYPGGGIKGGYPGDVGGGMGGEMGGEMGGGYPGGMEEWMGGGFPGSKLPGMGGQPVYNPSVPYHDMIPGGLFPKKTIVIRGMVPHGADGIKINFMVSRSQDIAFHINPRVKDGIVVRNSLIDGDWGDEETELSTNPFTEGQYFDMSIRCGSQKFKVFVNGQHLFDYFHRIQSFSEIDKLEIAGDVEITYVHF